MRHLLLEIACVSIPTFFIETLFPISPIFTQIVGWVAGVSSLSWIGLTLVWLHFENEYQKKWSANK